MPNITNAARANPTIALMTICSFIQTRKPSLLQAVNIKMLTRQTNTLESLAQNRLVTFITGSSLFFNVFNTYVYAIVARIRKGDAAFVGLAVVFYRLCQSFVISFFISIVFECLFERLFESFFG